jgi:ribonuclease E
MAGESQQSQLGFAPTDAPAQTSEGTAPQARDDSSGEGREKRSRDRYGRERGPRQDRGERAERPNLTEESPAVAAQQPVAATAAPVPAVAPAIAQATGAATSMVTATSTGMPKVGSYTLPKETLVEVAQGSGLQWVNSDPARIAAVQAAIAAEPKPVHVPRERPAPVVLDDRPLVLVETKRDLRNMTLPFEQETAA